MPLHRTVDRVEQLSALDPVVQAVQKVVRRATGGQPVRDLLHGVWLGHPLHPALVQLPIGSWLAAGVLDAVRPGATAESATLVAGGLAAAVPAAVAGWTDWAEMHEQQLRTGLVHAAANVLAVGWYAGSLTARLRGRPGRGRLLGWAGLATVTVGGWLGGHLAYRQAAGANHAEHVPHLLPAGWIPLGRLDDVPPGQLTERRVGTVPLLVLRTGEQVHVVADTCSHLSAPLHEGKLSDEDGEPCVTCPWHGSAFRLRDGGVVHGPATAPLPALQTRVVAGQLEVLLEGAG